MQNLEQLSLALRNNSQAEADLLGLNEQYSDATKLRDSRGAKINQYGSVSPFSVIADTINNSRGRRDVRELAPQRKTARENIAANKYALPLYKAQQEQNALDLAANRYETEQKQLTQALDLEAGRYATGQTQDQNALDLEAGQYATGQTQDQAALDLEASRYEAKQATLLKKSLAKEAQENAALALAAEKYEAEQGARIGSPTNYTNSTTGVKLKVWNTKKGLVDSRNRPVTSLEGFDKDATKTTQVPNFNGYGNDITDKLATNHALLMGSADRVGAKANALSATAVAEIDSGSVRLGEFLLDTFTPKKANAMVKSEFSGYSPEAKDFLVGLARMSADERHELFGAALTEGEELSGEKFLAFVQGLTLEQIMSRVGDTYRNNEDKLRSLDAINGGNKYMTIPSAAKWSAFDEKEVESVAELSALDAEIAALEAEIAAGSGN